MCENCDSLNQFMVIVMVGGLGVMRRSIIVNLSIETVMRIRSYINNYKNNPL